MGNSRRTLIATIIGARPQFIKAAAVSGAMRRYTTLREIVIHTGQHYDYEMSKIFFRQLDIPAPDYNLKTGSGTHAAQTGAMLIKIEEVLARERPHLALVYGDTNSTLAGALAAAKLNIPVAHVEAGMRSFNRQMPEEINRVAADNVSVLHFCSTRTAVKNLQNEGIREGIFLPGDVMYDAAVQSIAAAENYSTVLRDIKVQPKGYFLATVHRQSNTDDPGNLKSILDAFARMDKPVVFPVHPRTRKALHAAGAMRPGSTGRYRNILFTDPVGYLDMLVLEKNAGMILTDSGGVQKEAYFFGVPCVTLRDETEWIETIQAGGNELAGADTARILRAAGRAHPPVRDRGIFGNGNAGRNICRIIAARRGEYT